MVLGCVVSPSGAETDPAKARALKERREQLARDSEYSRDHGRIGYVGNQAPALEGSTVPGE